MTGPDEVFTGVLLLPSRRMFTTTSLVTLGDGEPVATIRWHTWTGRFEILDASGVSEWARGGQDTLSMELTRPVLSMLEAIGLAQCLRTALAVHNSSAASTAGGGGAA